MQDIILVGSGGCMREVLFQIEELNKNTPTWNVLGFVDEYYDEKNENVKRIQKNYSYLGKDEVLLNASQDMNVAVCVGESQLRKKIVSKLKQNPYIHFPNVVLSNVIIASDAVLGEGCIISRNSVISTGVVLGDFVFLNMDVRICHEGVLADFVTMSPKAALAGNVCIGESAEIGMNATVIQGINIGAKAIIGAGAVVINDIMDKAKVVGVPAKNVQ